MFSGWESLNNDFSLVKQLQCGLNHITGSQKPFWSVTSAVSKVSVGEVAVRVVMAGAHGGLAHPTASLPERAPRKNELLAVTGQILDWWHLESIF